MTREEEVLEYSKPKPEGGFVLVTCHEILALWGCYRDEILNLDDIRVWLSLFELAARRKQLKKCAPRLYQLHEIAKLTNKPTRVVKKSLIRLEVLGFAKVWKSGIAFRFSNVYEVTLERPTVKEMIANTKNHRRKIPVPRRMLRELAISRSPAFIATVFGQLIRCLYLRNHQCRPIGACKISWIAQVFGRHPRNIKRARSKLVELGWLVPMDADDWYIQLYGQRSRINLEWGREEKSPRGSVRNGPKSPPPYINKYLSTRLNIHPSKRGKDGACKQAKIKGDGKRWLGWIANGELRSGEGIERLFQKAVRAGYVENSINGRQRIAAAAAHALRIATKNPPGLFTWLVTNRRWDYIAGKDEILVLKSKVNHQRREEIPSRAGRSNCLNQFLNVGASSVQVT